MLARFAFVAAIVAVAAATVVAPARAATRLLEIVNKTECVLHVVVQTGVGANGPKSEIALQPNGTWGITDPGMYWLEGVLTKTGAPSVTLQKRGILVEKGQRMMTLMALYDSVVTSSYRWNLKS